MKKYLKDCLNFIKESRVYILIIAGIYALSFMLGFFSEFKDTINILKKFGGEDRATFERMENKLEKGPYKNNKVSVEERNLKHLKKIFIKNLSRAIISFFTGIILGAFPIFMTIINGFVLGVVAKFAMLLYGPKFNFGFFHGILEIPIFIILHGLYLRLGLSYIIPSAKGRKENFRYAFWNIIRIAPIYIILLLIAAAIEEYITPRIWNLFFGMC